MLQVNSRLVIVVSAIAPLVLWRVHALSGKPHPEQATPGAEPEAVPVSSGGTGSRSGTGAEAPEGLPPGVPAEHVATALRWLQADPELTGTAIGELLHTSDSYGRRVRRAALAGRAGAGART